jgi:hypothetical protein
MITVHIYELLCVCMNAPGFAETAWNWKGGTTRNNLAKKRE